MFAGARGMLASPAADQRTTLASADSFGAYPEFEES